jgi:hypothetical protein
MTAKRLYLGACHCGSVRFRFWSEPVTQGRRCNCSICVRKGIVLSAGYFSPAELEVLDGASTLALYRFGDGHVNHLFCRKCGICPFNTIEAVPPEYDGPARPGYYRVNLGCVDELDVFALEIGLIDGRSL